MKKDNSGWRDLPAHVLAELVELRVENDMLQARNAELLAACKEALGEFYLSASNTILRAAVTKAEGER